MESAVSSASATASVEYGVLIPVAVHFDDLDAFGMLHNTRFAVLVERAWNEYWWSQGFGVQDGIRQSRIVRDDTFNVIKAMNIEFDLPVMHAGDYAVHLWMERLGRTSATAGFRVCDAAGSTTHAHGTRAVVCLDPATMRPTEWSDRVREVSRNLLRPQD